MNKATINKTFALIPAIGGLAVGVLLTLLLSNSEHGKRHSASSEKTLLYWVAPMDPNYRRDKPGLSPMGMDLIPYYEGGEIANDAGPGTISISPNVINNLGVRTGLVVRQALHSEIITVGYVQYDENKLIHIHPRVSGWIEKLHVKAEGDPVEKGMPLYSLYSPELVNAQEELALAVSRKNHRLIQASENRLKSLKISKEFINELKRTLKVKQTINFYAPQSGVVDNLNIREGYFVKPGTTMLSIGALDRVWVEAEIFERQAPLVKTNDPVTMTLDYLPGKEWIGEVDYIYPTLDSKTRTMRIRISFDNANRELKPNMFAKVSVQTNSDEQVLAIPREALIRTGTQDRVVLALGEGSFKSVAVKLGRSDQNTVEIIEGLEEGESVVISAQFLLDSESSKTSDFKRMHHEERVQEQEQVANSVWVAGEIKIRTDADRTVIARHDPIETWDWPAMTMKFSVHQDIDFETLKPATHLQMEIRKLDSGGYEISDVLITNQDATVEE